ncbi:hypothetical protein EGCR1_00050 [Enterococcus gilvus]|uniref:hypothetical protein n=1 Tax=Enterococcus gilvus TaxID=160453 RepID=UPI000DF5F146|nr:hypothetical protein [Enterococcus gilvus]AXG37179.1 hypothetical protein EGCR1_00050 [Enterococcus gilvus]
MKKRKMKVLSMTVLIISTYIIGLFGLNSDKASAETLQDNLVITNYYAEKRPGGGASLETGQQLRVHMEFNVDPLPEGTAVGDTFEISIPNDYNFSYHWSSGVLGNTPSDPYLTYEIQGDKIIFTICEAAVEAQRLHKGVLDLTATARKAGENIDGGGNGMGDLLEVTDAPDPTVPDPEDRPFPDESKYLHKEGKQVNGQNAIAWAVRTNYLDYGAAFDYYTKDQGATKIVDKANGLLVDHLVPGTHFREDSLWVTVPTYIITTEDAGSRMGDRQLGANISGAPQKVNFSDFVIEKEGNGNAFLKLEPTEGQSYQEFQDYVQAYPDANNGQRAYGVYKHADETETVLVAFGTMPGSTHYYEDLKAHYTDFGEADIHDAIDADLSLTGDQKTQLHDIYGKRDESPSNGAIMAYDVSFSVDVDVPEYGSGKYQNDLSFLYNDNDSEDTRTETDFDAIWGDVEADFLKAYKKVSGDDEKELSEEKIFKFNISDRYGTVVAYGKTVTEVTHKGREVEIKFYRDENYTIPIENVDKNNPNYWSNFLIDGRWYYINEIDTDGYEVHIQDTNGKETNQFKYDSKQDHRWRFIVINKEPIKIEAEKKIIGVGSLANDKEFEFELRDTRDDSAVAFGKTTITTTDGKNTNKPITFYTDNTYSEVITNWKKMTIDGVETVILEDGVTYELVEVDSQGYNVTYYTKDPSTGDSIEGNTYTADYENGGKISFAVTNKDTLDFEANKKVEGTGLLTPNKTYKFEIKDITTAGNPVVAYGKVTVTEKGQNQAIEFFTTSDYSASNKITDWAKILREDKKYQLIETDTQNYRPIYSGGTGEKNNEFQVVHNDPSKKITLNTENQNTFDFSAKKKVTGDGVFDGETFKFQLVNSSNQVVAHGKAEVNAKDTDIPITFYKDIEDEGTIITDWTEILTEGESYQLKEVDDSGYAVTYKDQDGTETNQFTVQFNTGKSMSIHVENRRGRVPLPETGGEGLTQQLIFASAFLAFVILIGGIVEYRRKAGV